MIRHQFPLSLTAILLGIKSNFIFFLIFVSYMCLPTSMTGQEAPTSQQSSIEVDGNISPLSDSENEEFDSDRGFSNFSTNHSEEMTDDFQAKFLHMLLILGLLIGFMVLASWALKRLMRSRITQLNTASSIKVLETRSLSPRATLYLVEINNQELLIAESPTTVTHLASFPLSQTEEEKIRQEWQRHSQSTPTTSNDI